MALGEQSTFILIIDNSVGHFQTTLANKYGKLDNIRAFDETFKS